MPNQATKRYCVSTRDLATLAHDGLGWGHELDCGCFHVVAAAAPAKPTLMARAIATLKKRS